MSITIKLSMVKYSTSRVPKYNYTFKHVSAIFKRLDWNFVVTPPATMIVDVSKTFPTKEEAIIGRKELDRALWPVQIRLDEVIYE